jgi:hypothetical protein
MDAEALTVSPSNIEPRILEVRGQKVILDATLAQMYGVTTRRLMEQLKRNRARFPRDFLFQLTRQEMALVEEGLTMKGWGGRRRLPYAFTEHGAIMVASILNSRRAVEASVFVVRAFVKLRSMLVAHSELARKLDALERSVATHDKEIQSLFDAIRQLMAPPEGHKHRIGFDLNGS